MMMRRNPGRMHLLPAVVSRLSANLDRRRRLLRQVDRNRNSSQRKSAVLSYLSRLVVAAAVVRADLPRMT